MQTLKALECIFADGSVPSDGSAPLRATVQARIIPLNVDLVQPLVFKRANKTALDITGWSIPYTVKDAVSGTERLKLLANITNGPAGLAEVKIYRNRTAPGGSASAITEGLFDVHGQDPVTGFNWRVVEPSSWMPSPSEGDASVPPPTPAPTPMEFLYGAGQTCDLSKLVTMWSPTAIDQSIALPDAIADGIQHRITIGALAAPGDNIERPSVSGTGIAVVPPSSISGTSWLFQWDTGAWRLVESSYPPGGIQTSAAELANYAPGIYRGWFAYTLDTGIVYFCDGTNWLAVTVEAP